MKIREYVTNIKSYPVDKTYQRPEGVWSKEDQQCLIDTIIKGEPMPLFFFNAINDKFYVVDGQQRLFSIKEFYNDKLIVVNSATDFLDKYENIGGMLNVAKKTVKRPIQIIPKLINVFKEEKGNKFRKIQNPSVYLL